MAADDARIRALEAQNAQLCARVCLLSQKMSFFDTILPLNATLSPEAVAPAPVSFLPPPSPASVAPTLNGIGVSTDEPAALIARPAVAGEPGSLQSEAHQHHFQSVESPPCRTTFSLSGSLLSHQHPQQQLPLLTWMIMWVVWTCLSWVSTHMEIVLHRLTPILSQVKSAPHQTALMGSSAGKHLSGGMSWQPFRHILDSPLWHQYRKLARCRVKHF